MKLLSSVENLSSHPVCLTHSVGSLHLCPDARESPSPVDWYSVWQVKDLIFSSQVDDSQRDKKVTEVDSSVKDAQYKKVTNTNK